MPYIKDAEYLVYLTLLQVSSETFKFQETTVAHPLILRQYLVISLRQYSMIILPQWVLLSPSGELESEGLIPIML